MRHGGARRTGERLDYAFAGGDPDPASFPRAALAESAARALAEDGERALAYGEPQGALALRELVCDNYQRFEGLSVSPDRVQIANGSIHAIALALGAFLDPGDAVVCESPTFPGALNVMRRHTSRVVGAPIDDDGIVPEALRERLAALRGEGVRCKLVYTIPNFQNPSGVTQSRARREALVEIADEFDLLLLEDDAYGELRFEGEALPSLLSLDTRGRVLRTGTLSKILAPGLRIGWIVAPADLVRALSLYNFGGGVNPFGSLVATRYLREHLVAHVAELVEVYRARRDAMLRGLGEGLVGTGAHVSRPAGGFFAWVTLPPGVDMARLSELAADASVAFQPGKGFFVEAGGERCARLAYSQEPPERCYEGARLFASAVRAATLT
ncbi:MAG TPA: PLP-dependent aminotransferase family protein [Byssovorax sp.]|jgi:2-aminoadipate transaminase